MKKAVLFKLVCTVIVLVGGVSIAAQFNLPIPPISEIVKINNSSVRTSLPSIEDTVSSSKTHFQKQVESGSKAQITDEIVYFVYFNHILGFQDRAQKATLKGEHFDYDRIYAKQTGLDYQERQLLYQTANDCINAVKQVDKEAEAIIYELRSKLKDGKANSIQEIPKPSEELSKLQKKRDETILQYRDKLKDSFGDENFVGFDKKVKEIVIPNIRLNIQGAK